MTEEAQHRRPGRSKLWIAVLALTILVAIIVIPPLVSINKYKSRIARAISSSLARPVRLSGVELRLLPQPGFVINDLTVDEDPAYGAEPVLHANTVTAAIRLSSLWRGRLEMSRISVDEASLNLVRTPDGRWNLDTLFRTAENSQKDGANRRRPVPLPYLEATDSRIHIKEGVEKLPFSLVNADLSFWEEDPGDWRVRLTGQPARTDVNLDLSDTGIVQLEGRMRRALELRQMPIHVEMEWREAQMGQLSRLLIGSDAGWRGNVTAEMKLDGTADSAVVTTRLRATGVHREEFAPAEPLDFDANCGFTYHYSARAIEKLICDSPLGDGHFRLEGSLPANGQPKLSLAVDKIPAQAVLDALRTVRQELGAGLDADGTLSGKLNYDATAPAPITVTLPKPSHHGRMVQDTKQAPGTVSPLSGSISVDGLRLSGGSLSQPVQLQKVRLEPAAGTNGQGSVLAGTASVPAGAPVPLLFSVRLSLKSYHVTARGSGSPARVRQLAHAAGLKEAGALDAIGGDSLTMDLAIEGPWLPAPEALLAESVSAAPGSPAVVALPTSDRLTGTITLHDANWKTDSIVTALEIPEATLHLGGGAMIWDPVTFAYGPLKGTARVKIPVCEAADEPCLPTVDVNFPTLDAAEFQATLLGSQKKGTLLATVIARLTPSSTRPWPALRGTLKADAFHIGPVTLEGFRADVKMSREEVEITNVDAGLLGGQLHMTGKVENGDKPGYSFDGQFAQGSAADLCALFELKCAGASFDGEGKLEAVGFAGDDLASSAKGMLHFEWRKGAIAARDSKSNIGVPLLLTRFDTWSGDAAIGDGGVTLKENHVQQGSHKRSVSVSIKFGDPPTVAFTPAKIAAVSKK